MFGPTYSPIKLKLNLDLSIKRLKLLQQKHDNAGTLTRKEVAKYLERQKIDLAEIKTEQIVRDDYYREALEILEMFCNLLLTRFGLLDSKKDCDDGLREAVYTIIWCAPRISADLREFNEIKKQLTYRFGKELVEAASSSENPYVNKRVVHKLSVAAPPQHMVKGYLRVIAETYKVKWQDKWGETPSLIDTNVPDTLQGSDFGDGKAGGAGGGGGGYGGFGGKAAVDNDLAGLAFPPAMGSSAYAPPAAAAAAGGASAAYPPQQQPEMYPPQQPPQQQQPELYPPQRTHTGPPPSYSDPSPAAALDPFPSVPAASGADQHPASSIIPDLPAVPTGAPGRGGGGGGGGFGGGASSVPPGSDSVPDFDDLARRLNALKSRS